MAYLDNFKEKRESTTYMLCVMGVVHPGCDNSHTYVAEVRKFDDLALVFFSQTF